MLIKKQMTSNPMLKPLYSAFINLPSPSSISLLWNFGSLLGMTLIMQIITGIILTFHYTPYSIMALSSLINMLHNYPHMWLMNYLHSNGASLFFILIYLHIARNLYYCTFKNFHTWMSGVMMLFLLMATAFMGYILPWGQMSYWGTTVITNLMYPIPYIGPDLVKWLWGGFSIDVPTLKRFFSLHFLLPFIILMMTLIHLIYLHQKGSSNPSSLPNNLDKIQFHPFFSIKDMMSAIITLTLMSFMILKYPLLLSDPENFNPANPMITPLHIQPEWYFLFAYAILRSIPNKLGGVIALLMSILILFLPPLISNSPILTFKFNPCKKMLFWIFINSFIILTWIGANPVENPYLIIGQTFSFIYFISFILMFLL